MITADLGQELEAFVAQLVDKGRYRDQEEVLREAVRLIQAREVQLAAFDTMMAQAIAQSDAGEGTPAEEVFDRLAAKYRAMAGQ